MVLGVAPVVRDPLEVLEILREDGVLGIRDPFLREEPGLDPFGQLHLLDGVEEGDLADLFQVVLDGVGGSTGRDDLLLRLVGVVLVREGEAFLLDEFLLEGGFFLLHELGVVHLVEGALLAPDLQHDVVTVSLYLNLDLARGELRNGWFGVLDGGLRLGAGTCGLGRSGLRGLRGGLGRGPGSLCCGRPGRGLRRLGTGGLLFDLGLRPPRGLGLGTLLGGLGLLLHGCSGGLPRATTGALRSLFGARTRGHSVFSSHLGTGHPRCGQGVSKSIFPRAPRTLKHDPLRGFPDPDPTARPATSYQGLIHP